MVAARMPKKYTPVPPSEMPVTYTRDSSTL
jgi:hypothetical protein